MFAETLNVSPNSISPIFLRAVDLPQPFSPMNARIGRVGISSGKRIEIIQICSNTEKASLDSLSAKGMESISSDLIALSGSRLSFGMYFHSLYTWFSLKIAELTPAHIVSGLESGAIYRMPFPPVCK